MTDTPRNDPNTPEETENKNDFQFPEVSFEDIPSKGKHFFSRYFWAPPVNF